MIWREQGPRLQGFGKVRQTKRARKTGLSVLSKGGHYTNTHTNRIMLLSKMTDLFSLLSSTHFSVMVL